MLNSIGLENHSMGSRTPEGVAEVTTIMAQFNQGDSIGALAIGHFTHRLDDEDGDHFAVIIPTLDQENLSLSFVDSYIPSILNMQQYAESNGIPYTIHYNSTQGPVGITIELGNAQADVAQSFFQDSNLNNLEVIPVLDETITQGIPANMIAIYELAYGQE